ncbi:MAG: MFS transporter [Myxococcota bacterium]
MQDSVGDGGPAHDADGARERVARPWWLPHFLGRVPLGLDERHVSLVGVVALAALFENYDQSMLTSAFKQIREGFELTQAEAATWFGWIRLGAIPAIIVLPLADRLGRRSVFLVAIVGMSIGTLISGFAPNVESFVAMQTITRTFIVAAISCAIVIIAEELPAANRGWGIGILGAIGAFGYGLGAILYAFIDYLPYGWRAMYMVGGVPLLLMPRFMRQIPETARFLEERAERLAGRRPESGWISPLVELVRRYPGRVVAVAAMALFFATGSSPAFGLLSDFVQTTHDWGPADFSLMALVAGTFGIVGNSAMGWAADRWGRRPVAIVGFGLFPATAFALYFGPETTLPLVWVPFVFLLTGGNVLMRIIVTELFPTSSRNTAMGWGTLMETLGGATGYWLVGGFTAVGASIAPAAVGVSLLTLVAVVVMLFIPETAGRELEETSQNA